jgi:hypothetical protein
MPSKSVESYRRASDAGNTLASANLGNRLLNAGFVDEARELLDAAMKEPEPHANVSSHLASIESTTTAENERETEILADAQREREFLRRYATARLVAGETPDLSGDWLRNDTRVTMVQTGRTFTASFTEGDTPARFEGQIVNRAIEVEYFVEGYKPLTTGSSLEKEYVRKGSGLGFVSQEGSAIDLVI